MVIPDITVLGNPVVHIGYTVESIPRAVDHLVTHFGAGPFFLMKDIRIDRLENSNGPVVWEHSAAFGAWGGTIVELQQIDTLEPADAFGPTYQQARGFNHVAYAVDDLEQEDARLRGLGLTQLFWAVNGPHHSALYDAPLLGHTIEVHKSFPLFHEFHADLAQAAEGWDGSDPLRPVRADVQEQIVSDGSVS